MLKLLLINVVTPVVTSLTDYFKSKTHTALCLFGILSIVYFVTCIFVTDNFDEWQQCTERLPKWIEEIAVTDSNGKSILYDRQPDGTVKLALRSDHNGDS